MSLFKSIGLFLLISSSLLSTSYSGRQPAIVNNISPEKPKAVHEARETIEPLGHEELLHGRFLGVNTQDYGTYDPAPSFARPRFKLIPN